jgi:hypothetical protein
VGVHLHDAGSLLKTIFRVTELRQSADNGTARSSSTELNRKLKMLVNFKLDFDQHAQVLRLTKFALGTTEVDSSVSMRLSLV